MLECVNVIWIILINVTKYININNFNLILSLLKCTIDRIVFFLIWDSVDCVMFGDKRKKYIL